MYLYRAPNNVYFTRICLAKYLRDKGFPFDVKVSLLTRDRAEAVIRNIDVAGALKKIIKSIDHQTRINDFIRYVDDVINHLRAQFDVADSDITFNITPKSHAIPIRDTKLSEHRETIAIDLVCSFQSMKLKSQGTYKPEPDWLMTNRLLNRSPQIRT
ncbi:hypothetical protein [Shewanella ulleungensis]|uniref:hypothetical protein n=1 Tax=Shewanella ulleungensis TaxID=2282699 RepID=UPI003D7B8240